MRSLIIAIPLLLPVPAIAVDKLNPAIEVTPCVVIILPDGSKACAPPKVSQAPACIRMEVREKGKFVKYIWVCTPPREPKTEPKKDEPKSVGGY